MAQNIKSSTELKSLPQYELVKEEYIDGLKSLGLVFRHKKSGARLVILSNDDDNKVFSIGFRTPPKDSTGVAHIVEHTVLCGSKEFPSKDPFVELAKGSLNTFLNAMTFSDKTLYPIASCNEKDFQNLMHVYMDAVFYPNIYYKKEIFQQEGWYYELENKEDELKYNGVVYNEMKGVFSSPEQILYRSIQCSLFPDTTYGIESGGDPKNIPDLSYEEFLAFHKKYYHPSNSYIYIYGDMDIEEKMEWLDEKYLSKFDVAEVDSEIKRQKPFESMKTVIDYYSVSEGEAEKAKAYLSYNVVLNTSLNKELYLAFDILEYALLKSPGAPLKQALIDAKIGKDILSQYENGIYQPYFSIIAKEAEEDQQEIFVETIKKTLGEIAEKGIGEKALKAAINYHEFRYKEGDFGSYPKGLMYGIQVLDSWLYDDDTPFIHINADKTFQFMKKNINTGYFEKLIKTYLIDNPHGTIVAVLPKAGLTAAEDAKVKEKLAKYKESLSDAEIDKIIEETKALRLFQETPSTKEELEKIPLLTRGDIRRKVNKILNEKYNIANVTALHHNMNTNGIGYLKIGFALKDYVGYGRYLSLLSFIIGKVNTRSYSFQDFANEMDIHTGGITVDVESYEVLDEKDAFKPYFEITCKTLYENINKTLQLVSEMLLSSQLDDEKRLREIISETRSKMRIKMNSNSHSLAAGRALSYVSKSAQFNDTLVGWEFYEFLTDLEEHFDERKDELVGTLKGLVNGFITRENMIFSVTADEEGFQIFEKEAVDFVQKIETASGKVYNSQPVLEKIESLPDLEKQNEGFKTAGQVQFVALGGNFLKEGGTYDGALRVLKTALSYDYLWNFVRVKGGAYGCMCSFLRNGNGYFVSYRDPNLGETLEVFAHAVDYTKEFNVDDRDMTKYVLGTISMTDTPLNPAAKGVRSFTCYMTGVTEERLQKERDSIIDANVESIRALAVKLQAILDDCVICAVGNENKIDECSQIFSKTFNL